MYHTAVHKTAVPGASLVVAARPLRDATLSIQNQHLRRRGGLYHYRRRLPAPLKEILNRTYFDGSLATADPAQARKFARRIIAD